MVEFRSGRRQSVRRPSPLITPQPVSLPSIPCLAGYIAGGINFSRDTYEQKKTRAEQIEARPGRRKHPGFEVVAWKRPAGSG